MVITERSFWRRYTQKKLKPNTKTCKKSNTQAKIDADDSTNERLNYLHILNNHSNRQTEQTQLDARADITKPRSNFHQDNAEFYKRIELVKCGIFYDKTYADESRNGREFLRDFICDD